MKSRFLFVILSLMFVSGYGQCRRLYVDMFTQKGDAHNELVVATGIRAIYGDDFLLSHLEKYGKTLMELTFSNDSTIDSIELIPSVCFLTEEGNTERWEQLKAYLQQQTFYSHGPHHRLGYPEPEKTIISLSFVGSLFDFCGFRMKNPGKNWIDFFDYYEEFFKTYKFKLYEFD